MALGETTTVRTIDSRVAHVHHDAPAVARVWRDVSWGARGVQARGRQRARVLLGRRARTRLCPAADCQWGAATWRRGDAPTSVMIHYKVSGGMSSFYSLLFINLGSSVYSVQCLFHSFLAAAIAVAMSTNIARDDLESLIRQPSVYFNGFASCLGFLLVFRANLAYQRYWEAITRITELISKLRDVAIQVATFVQSNDDDAASWKSTQLRRLALYNSLAIMELRDGALDLDLFVKEGTLTEDEKEVLAATGNKPALVMVWLVDAWVVRSVRFFPVPCSQTCGTRR